MSLIGALNIGQTALATSSAALQVTGNNVANAGNPNYSEQVANFGELPDQNIGGSVFVGTGVELTSVQRQVDESLSSRLNSAISDFQAANSTANWSGQIESIFNALGSSSLDTTLGTFFNNWSSLANNPTSASARQAVEQSGEQVANQFNNLNGGLAQLQQNVGSQLGGLVTSANQLATQIANLNSQIALSGAGPAGSDNALLDQRDAAVQKLSSLVNVTTVQQGNGTVNVYIGSEPLVNGTFSSGLALQTQSNGNQINYNVVFQSNGGNASVTGGQIGALVGAQTQTNAVISQLNALSQGVINGLNELHASGQGTEGYAAVSATNIVSNTTVPLNSSQTGLQLTPGNGSFVVHMTNTATGLSSSTLVQVNLTGSPGDTTLDSLTASLNSIPGVTATDLGGKLSLQAASGMQIGFSQDSSNTLASLGINTFFSGNSAATMAVNSTIAANTNLIAAAQNGDSGDNSNALAIAQLGDTPQSSLTGTSINQAYAGMVGGIATTTATAKSNATASQDVQTTLQTQQESLSGVSIDNETINMLQQQRAYQGAARLISTIDQMMQTLLQMT